ncbi:putative lipoprotein [Escherichia coli TW07509]|nr:putative lipoprotein [Escherichia coli TW07509]
MLNLLLFISVSTAFCKQQNSEKKNIHQGFYIKPSGSYGFYLYRA